MPLKVNIRRLEDGDVPLRGELSAAELELELPEELVHARQGATYDLVAQKVGHGILVQGKVGLMLECECARCLKPFQHRLDLNWTVHIPMEGEEKAEIKDDSVDLTPFLREDILLEYPQHPLCDADCAGLPNRADKSAKQKKGDASQTPESSVWSKLNKLKF